jgi:phage tail sheath protein FI
MPTYISPGVYTTILDLSLYIPNLSTTILGVVGAASKGPMDEATYISNVLTFVSTFGNPNPNYSAPYAALQALRYARQMFFVRVAGASAAASSAALKEKATTASVTAGVAGPYTIRSTANDVLRVKIDAGSFVPITLTDGVRTATQVAAEIADALGAGSTVTVNSDQTITITTDTVGSGGAVTIDTVGNGSTANSTLGFAAGAVVGSAATAASVQGKNVNQPYTVVTGSNDKLDLVIDGTIYNVTLTAGDRAAADIASDIETIITTFGVAEAVLDGSNNVVKISSGTTGTSSSVQILGSSTAAGLLGLDLAVHMGAAATQAAVDGTVAGPFSLGINNTLKLRFNAGTLRTVALANGVTTAQAAADAINVVIGSNGYNEGVASVSSAGKLVIATLVAGAAGSVQVDGSGTGQYAFNFSTAEFTGTGDPTTTTVTVTAASKGTHGDNLKVVIGAPANGLSTSFKLSVYDGDAYVESYEDLNKVSSDANFCETIINGNSAYITVENNDSSTVVPAFTTSTLSGGNDGISDIDDSDYIGELTPVKTGLQLFANAEDFDLNLLSVPGVSSGAVINEMLTICATRGDCMAIVDPPLGLTVQQVVDWHNGAGAYGDHQAFNTFYGALYWPWLQIYDAVNKQKVWVPPSGLVAGVYAFTDYTTETWYAPAGLNRGHLLQPLKLEYNPDLGERDLLYGNQNAVNPIVNFRKDGITVWGQRSLQRKPSALDRVNVVRLVLYLRKVIATAVRYLVFEPNDPITWATFVNLVQPYMETVKQRRGVYDYRVICDANTNPPDAIDRNEMHGIVAFKPTKAAEFIEVKFVVTNTGTNFDDLTF